MGLLVALTVLVLAASLSLTAGVRSRAERVIAVSLVATALTVGPIYVLGLTGHLDRLTLGLASGGLSALALAWFVRAHEGGASRAGKALGKSALELAVLPLEGITRAFRIRSLTTAGAAAAALVFPYMLLSAYLAPAWRDWDALWYHEPLVGFTIQNHGFSPVPLPANLQVINGVHRLCEMTQVWFAIYGGRRVVDVANVVFMPLLAASMFALARRYTRDVVTGVAWASALVLLPGFLRLTQSTMVDPESCALLLAAAYWVTHPELDRRSAVFAILGLTLAVGAKIWSIIPVGLLSLYLLVRLIRSRRELGGGATAALALGGAASVLGMQAVTYLRNLRNYGNPLWPVVQYDNAALGIHWKGTMSLSANAGIDFNEPLDVLAKKMLAAPFTGMGTGHDWQIHDYGFAWSWVVLPLSAVALALVVATFAGGLVARVARLRRAGPKDAVVAGAAMLGVTAGVSLYLSPALHIARYHVASLGMLAACVCWMSGRTKGSRLAVNAALIAQIGSILMLYWAPRKAPFVSIYTPAQIAHWLKTPYPAREVEDIGTPEVPRMLISPVTPATGLAREREVKAGDVVAFDRIDFPALLWNNDYSNRVVWLSSSDPLAEAERIGARWVYTRPGSTLSRELVRAPSRWERVGPLEAERFGRVWRHKR